VRCGGFFAVAPGHFSFLIPPACSFTPVQFTLGQDVTVQLLGNINLPSNITEVQAGVTGKNYRSGWFSVTSTGPGVSLVGPTTASARLKGGIIRSYGQVRCAIYCLCARNNSAPALGMVGRRPTDVTPIAIRVESQVNFFLA
jgi:hypothetical protein